MLQVFVTIKDMDPLIIIIIWQLNSGLHAFSVTMLHILSRKSCFSYACVCEHTLEF